MENSAKSRVKNACNTGVNKFVQLLMPSPIKTHDFLQTTFRQSIWQMKESARQSLLSQASVSGRGSTLNMSDESHAPILQKFSHLRQPILDDRDDTSSVGYMSYRQPQSPFEGRH